MKKTVSGLKFFLFCKIAIGLLAIGSNASAETVYRENMFACESMAAYGEAQIMKERGDTRGLGHLVKQKRCFKVSFGTEYSVVGINADRDPTQWVKLRIYDGDSHFEVYSWYGFTF